MGEVLDPDLLDEDPFEVDRQAGHSFKHPRLGLQDVNDVWTADPLLYPAKPPAHWLMVAEVSGMVLVVPIAPAKSADPRKMPSDRLLRSLSWSRRQLQEGST